MGSQRVGESLSRTLYVFAVTQSGAEYVIQGSDGRLIHTTSSNADLPDFVGNTYRLDCDAIVGHGLVLRAIGTNHVLRSTPVMAVAVSSALLSPFTRQDVGQAAHTRHRIRMHRDHEEQRARGEGNWSISSDWEAINAHFDNR